MSVYVFKWDAWVAKRKDAGRFTIIYDALHASHRLIDATIRIRPWKRQLFLEERCTRNVTKSTCIRGNLYPRNFFTLRVGASCSGFARHPLQSRLVTRRPHDFLRVTTGGPLRALWRKHYSAEFRVGCIVSPAKRGATVAGQSALYRCHALVLQLARYISTCYSSTWSPFIKPLRNPVAKLIIQMLRYRPLFHSSKRGSRELVRFSNSRRNGIFHPETRSITLPDQIVPRTYKSRFRLIKLSERKMMAISSIMDNEEVPL